MGKEGGDLRTGLQNLSVSHPHLWNSSATSPSSKSHLENFLLDVFVRGDQDGRRLGER